MSLMRMTLVLAGMCWVNRGFCSSNDVNSCWLDESALFAMTAVKSKRWNHPSAPTATTKFWKNRKTDNHHDLNTSLKYSYFACANQTNLSFIADISNGDAGQLEDQNPNHGSMLHDAIRVIFDNFWFLHSPCPHMFLWARVWSHHSCTPATFHWCHQQPAHSATTETHSKMCKMWHLNRGLGRC